MFVKKFEAESMEAGLAQAKKELGPDALVLSTQQKKPRWFGKPLIELTVAAPSKDKDEAPTEEKLVEEYDEAMLKTIFPHRNQKAVDAVAEGDEDPKESVAQPPKAYSLRKTRLGKYLEQAGEKETGGGKREEKSFELYESLLLDRGISPKTAKDLVRRLIFDYPKEDRRRPSQIRQLLAKMAAKGIHTIHPSQFEAEPVWAALGVGGAGKTSLVVKLGLALKRRHFEVTLVGRDERKIVAQRQLSSYAKLIDVPFSRESKPMGEGKTAQLIDTPAFHLKNDPEEEAALRRICRGARTFVVLDANSRLSEMLRIVEFAKRYNPSAVAFTRLDVSLEHGVILDLLKETRLPLMGMSLSSSFQSPFKFYEPLELTESLFREVNDEQAT